MTWIGDRFAHKASEIDDSLKYFGENSLETWLSDMSDVISVQNQPMEAFVADSELLEELTDRVFGKYEELGGFLGMLTASAIYSTTYPVTLVDGPAPFADAIWFAGFLRFSRQGYEVGSWIGSGFD